MIRVLPALDCRDHWIDLCRREHPYCFVETPETLVDFQTSYLQLTLLDGGVLDGREAIKYSLGSRLSLEPAWALIRACHWKLATLLDGLEQLDFSGNVRDNSLLGVHTDLTVRKFFAKDSHIRSPSRLGLLDPLIAAPAIWSGNALARLLANDQFRELRGEKAETDATALLLQILEQPSEWLGLERGSRLYLLCRRQPRASLVPDYRLPEPRLKRVSR
ncbi:hypothetical protein [Marinobacterium aestuariivivens]|uniref:Uncharacterized protein n=1 Tax=Marinobacterium aestuariivivens TaxID=1698799 RepID=A0ABW2A536_9GAMM